MAVFRDVIRDLKSPWRILLKELSAFGVVGAVNVFVDLGVFNWLHFGHGLGPTTALVISTCVATTSGYFMNRHWSFSHRARTGLAREYTVFFGLNGIALLMGIAITDFTYYVLGRTDHLSINIARLLGIAVGTVFRFWAYKRWVFLAVEPPQQLPTEERATPAA